MTKRTIRVALLGGLLLLAANIVWATWPTGKVPYSPYVSIPRVMPRLWFANGAAANTSIYVADLRPSDEIFAVWYCDTTTGAATGSAHAWRNDTQICYYQANDSLRDTLSTAAGYLAILGHDANPMNPDLEVTRSRAR